MPLVAKHEEVGLVDATAVSDDLWGESLHVRGAVLSCRECGGRMHAKVSSLGLRFFAHLPGRLDECANYGETPLHREVKRALIAIIRALPGWRADPEVSGEGWRADVLANGPDGRRIAWEVQVSSIGGETAASRTARLVASGVEVCWLPFTRRHSLEGLPTAWLRRSDACGFTVVDGALAFENDGRHVWWGKPGVVLAAFVPAVCRGSVRWAPVLPLTDGQGGWTTEAHLERAASEARRQALPLRQRAHVFHDQPRADCFRCEWNAAAATRLADHLSQRRLPRERDARRG